MSILKDYESLPLVGEIGAANREQLAALYVREIGYDPFEDDPEITEEEVREILLEYAVIGFEGMGKPVPARFCIDGFEGTFRGWHDPSQDWNGWACPRFPLKEAEKIAEQVNAQPMDLQEMKLQDGVFICIDRNYEPEAEEERWEADDAGHFWIGAFSWCWEEVRPEEAEEVQQEEEGGAA